jgi:glyoxylase I family protein
MINLQAIHHIAIICSDYQISKRFYVDILGLKVRSEHYRNERNSWKLDLDLNGRYVIELFSFPNPPDRVSRPEASGLRHLAFEVENIQHSVQWLNQNNIATEAVRIDEYTGKKFTFFSDPDNLPLELYEI